MKNKTKYRFLFAGGGTGGHLYPALAVAQQIRAIIPEGEILFIGSKDKIESRVVPEYGFDFRGITISGFARKFDLNNLAFPFKLIYSSLKCLIINFTYKPKVAIGSGAYVSGPAIWAASIMGAKIILLEQNSYPGVTNRILEKRAEQIHLSFEESKKYFRDEKKLIVSGNPIRLNLSIQNRDESIKKFELDPTKKTLLVLGGSGGAKSINEAIAQNILQLTTMGIQIIWQTGKFYFETYKGYNTNTVKTFAFIDDMPSAYSACDLVLARSGATTIAELAHLGLPVVFVPSKNVAADHQFKNAKAISDTNGAELIEDDKLMNELSEVVIKLINDEDRLQTIKTNIKNFAKPLAANNIAKAAILLAEQN